MDYESSRSHKLGCWDGAASTTPVIDSFTTNEATADFEPGNDFADFLIDIGFGKECPDDTRELWRNRIKSNYRGDDGRKRIRMAAITLRDRDGLHGRLSDIRCPVLWLHGTSDAVYSVANAEEEIKLFVNSPDAQVQIVQDGQHFLSFSHPKEVDSALIQFIGRYGSEKGKL